MTAPSASEDPRLYCRRVQLIEIAEGVIVRRGMSQVRVAGQEAGRIVTTLLQAAAAGMPQSALINLFPEPSRQDVQGLVSTLVRARVLAVSAADGTERDTSDEGMFYWSCGVERAAVVARLEAAQLTIAGVNRVSRALVESLIAEGVRDMTVVDHPLMSNLRLYDDKGLLRRDAWPETLPRPRLYSEWREGAASERIDCVVCVSEYGAGHVLRSWNEWCLRREVLLLPVIIQDMIVRIGVLVRPGEGPCVECMRARENANLDRPTEMRLVETQDTVGQWVNGVHGAMASAAGHLGALEVSRLLGEWAPPRPAGSVLELNALRGVMTERIVLKVPRCAACGVSGTQSAVSHEREAWMPGHSEVQR